MGSFIVDQRTKDGMFNATALLKQWNLHTQNSGYVKQKDLKDFFVNKNTQEFIDALIEEEFLNTQNSPYLKSQDSEDVKQRNSVDKTTYRKSVYVSSRGKYSGGTWMHPILFVKFAMWLNPRFEVQVIKFVYDQMIKYRNDAGDAYRELSTAIYGLVGKDFMPTAMAKVSKGINFIIFGNHFPMIRNANGEEMVQRQLYELERKVADLINDGFLTSFDGVMDYLRMKWRQKHGQAAKN